jgi:predicted permease
MQISAIISQMAVLFLILAIGYIANRFRIMTAESNSLLTKIVINIAMPCTILSSVMSGEVEMTGNEALFFGLMIALTYIIAFILVIPVPRLLRSPKEDAGLYRFLIVFGNVGFMGFPVAQSIFGSASVFYVALFNIPFSIITFSVGILMVSGRGEKINPKLFINPALVASVLAVVIFVLKIKTPAVLADTASLLGRITTPAAMLIIGSTLASIPFKKVFTQWRLYPVTVIKLLIVPVVTWLVLRLFIHDALMLGILVVLSGMPTATSATMISMEYGGNERLASTGVFITTLFSLASIPALVFVLLT